MITTKQLYVTCGSTEVLKGIDFVAKAGTITAIVGPNGSGKTTFIKALSGDLPYKGIISINGTNIAQIDTATLATLRAVLPQSTSMYAPFLVGEVVALGLANQAGYRCSKRTNQLSQQALELVNLKRYAQHYYHELSGGQQARVQLARVLCQIWEPVVNSTPRWLLLDEPVANLDIHHQLVVMDIARNFAHRGGGVIAILHDLNLAAHYSDQLLLINQGTIQHRGAPQTVLTNENLRNVYKCCLAVGQLPKPGTPFILPQTAKHR
ncbi:heme ABC transporter ATP-binding protein [Bartonella sp. DGB2]|uniref:heme ABC transporter ATP-binding protein n=1 Tax=Bartonella sp. DGB2 TaxID=3388426 RepID=UPI0039900CC4